MLLKNRHPADELADVRTELKALQTREAELRNVLLTEGADRQGVGYVAVVITVKQERLDVSAVRKHFGGALGPFMVGQEVRQVRLSAREEGAVGK
jgi:hypothetical protein